MIFAWEKEFGEQYQAFSHKGIRFILLNAQLINSGLPDEARQIKWFEAELANATDRVMIMLHHPPYLCFPEEPSHYDNTDPPGRRWLLELVKEYRVEAMFAGHAHNFWYDRFGETDYYLAPSTCFVRQDYSEMLRVQPPVDSEFGRDDSAKLGYFLVNVFNKGHTVQFARTFGNELAPDDEFTKPGRLAPPPLENKIPRIGFDLRQNWAEISEVPPSGGLDEFDRKLVRNDYPLLALIEMGVRDIRIPLADLRDPVRSARLRSMCHLGLRPTIFSFGVPSEEDLVLINDNREIIFSWEMTVDWSALHQMQDDFIKLNEQLDLPIYLSRMRSKADLATGSLYFHVINHGFTLDDLPQLDELNRLSLAGIKGAIFRMGSDLPVLNTLFEIDR
ncbi:MAG: serine/threonine protein phosphatase, partial [Pseudomonadota bacterium]